MKSILSEIANVDSSRRALRSFGLLVGLVLIAIAAFAWWRGGWIIGLSEILLAGIGAFLVVAGLTVPVILKPVYIPWMALAFVLGYVMTRVLLTTVFYLAVTPIGALRRLLGKDPMRGRHDAGASSYWKVKEAQDPASVRLKRLY